MDQAKDIRRALMVARLLKSDGGSLPPEEHSEGESNALELARINAVKMLGLPENNTPEDRAKALGYTLPGFHGTNKNFSAFSNEWLGATTKAKSAQKAHFIASNPDTANSYVNLDHVHNDSPPAYAKLFKIPGAFQEFNAAETPKERWAVLEKYGLNYGSGQIIPVVVRPGNARVKDYRGQEYRDITYNDEIKAAKKTKKNAVIFKNTYDPGLYGNAGRTDVYAVMNPADIRSRFAAFDPARKHENDLLAAHGGTIHKADGGSLPPEEHESNLAKFMEGAHPYVLNPDGIPKVFYHGTVADITKFKMPEKSVGIWATRNPKLASEYATISARGSGNPAVYPLHIQLKNPASEKEFSDAWDEAAKDSSRLGWDTHGQRHRKILQGNGFDGAILGDSVVVFHPNQLKSAIGNRGTYDPANSDITKSSGGSISPEEHDANLAKFMEGAHPDMFNEDGSPKTFYHGTKHDFSEFKPPVGHGGLTYVSPLPAFVNEHMGIRYYDKNPESFAQGHGKQSRILPVHVNVKNPFDYENPQHMQKLIDYLDKNHPYFFEYNDLENLKQGHWRSLEQPEIFNALKPLGHDSMYVGENYYDNNRSPKTAKNLAIINPKAIKSALGNRGTFDPNEADITKASGGYIPDQHKAIRRAMMVARSLKSDGGSNDVGQNYFENLQSNLENPHPVLANAGELVTPYFKKRAAELSQIYNEGQKQLSILNEAAAPFKKIYDQELNEHMSKRPPSHNRKEWLAQMPISDYGKQYLAMKPEIDKTLRQIEQSNYDAKIIRDNNDKKRSLLPIINAYQQYQDLIENAHKNQNLTFQNMNVNDFNESPSIFIHKSPSFNRKQSSEYKLMMVNGEPVYARKSNHWGDFHTNVTDPKEAAEMLGISEADAERMAMNDPYGRITQKHHYWALDGGDHSSRASQAGYVPLSELSKYQLVKKADGGFVPDQEKSIKRAMMIAHSIHKSGGGELDSPLSKSFEKENRAGIIVSPKPGMGGGPPIKPESGFTYDPEAPADESRESWKFSTPNILGAALPPPVQAPIQNVPRQEKIAEHASKIFKSKGFHDTINHLFDHHGLSRFDSPLTTNQIQGMYEGTEEPSFFVTHPQMTDEHAQVLAPLLGFGFQQDSVIRSSHNSNKAYSQPAAFIGGSSKLTPEQLANITKLSQDNELSGYSQTVDGKGVKFLHFGPDEEYNNFLKRVKNVANAAKLPYQHFVNSSSELINAKDYLTRAFEKAGGHGLGAGLYEGSARPSDLFGRTVNHILAPYAKAVASEGYRLSPERLADTYGLTDEEKEHVRNSLLPTGKGDRTTVPLMTGDEQLDVRPTGVGGKPTVGDVLYALQNRSAAKGQIDPNDYSQDAMNKIANDISKEVKYHVDNSSKSAIGWYDAALKKAMAKYAEIFPELNSDKNKQMLFHALLGTTSQGNDVYSNSINATRLYSLLRDGSHSIPEAVNKLKGSFGNQTKAIENNLLKFHHLVEKNGYDKMRNLFNQTKTVSEWKNYLKNNKDLFGPDGKPLTVDGSANQKVTGWSVFGPKIGSFINNLHGDYSTLTADLWFTRTWNRLLGHNFIHTPLTEAKQYNDFKDALKAEYYGSSPFSPNENLKYKTSEGQFQFKNGKRVPWEFGQDATKLSKEQFDSMIDDPDKMLEYANQLHDQYKKSQYKDKSDLRRRAKNWIENRENPEALPRTDLERNFQQQTVEKAQKLLKKQGLDISVADIQAALWFHEKELFSKLGVASEKAEPADYADAANKTMDAIRNGTLYQSQMKAKPKKTALPELASGGLVDRALNLASKYTQNSPAKMVLAGLNKRGRS